MSRRERRTEIRDGEDQKKFTCSIPKNRSVATGQKLYRTYMFRNKCIGFICEKTLNNIEEHRVSERRSTHKEELKSTYLRQNCS